jgi:hypothetical protein
MGKNLDHYRKVIAKTKSADSNEKLDANKQIDTITEKMMEKVKTKLFTIEIVAEDLPKFDTALIEMSHRDGVAYRKKDIYIAMTKFFFETIEKNPEKIKIEKY